VATATSSSCSEKVPAAISVSDGTFDPVTENISPWPTQGPASYFPSIEKKYGRTIAEWQAIILDNPSAKHMELVQLLKSEYTMGHGHANALVAWTLAGNRA